MYLARKHLGISPGEWKSLPWWERKVYLDGFEQEEIIKTTRRPEDLTNAGTDPFAAAGFRVRKRRVR